MIRLLVMCEVILDLTDVYVSFKITLSIHVAMAIVNGGLQHGKAPAAALGIIQCATNLRYKIQNLTDQGYPSLTGLSHPCPERPFWMHNPLI